MIYLYISESVRTRKDEEKDLNIVHILKDISSMVAHRLVPLAMQTMLLVDQTAYLMISWGKKKLHI